MGSTCFLKFEIEFGEKNSVLDFLGCVSKEVRSYLWVQFNNLVDHFGSALTALLDSVLQLAQVESHAFFTQFRFDRIVKQVFLVDGTRLVTYRCHLFLY